MVSTSATFALFSLALSVGLAIPYVQDHHHAAAWPSFHNFPSAASRLPGYARRPFAGYPYSLSPSGKQVLGYGEEVVGTCTWTEENAYDRESIVDFTYSGGFRSSFSGLKAHHLNKYEDRQFSYQSCELNTIYRLSGPLLLQGPTWWDEEFALECPPDAFVSHFESYHDNKYEDRRFTMWCSAARNLQWGECVAGEDYVNKFDKPFEFSCPPQMSIVGIYSVHKNTFEDRRFKFKCCEMDRKIAV